jgi:hypothetical protein
MRAVEHSKNKSERTIWGFLLSWSDDSEEYQTMSGLKERPLTVTACRHSFSGGTSYGAPNVIGIVKRQTTVRQHMFTNEHIDDNRLI